METSIPIYHHMSPQCRFTAVNNGLSDNDDGGSIFASSPLEPSEWQKGSRPTSSLRQHKKIHSKPAEHKGHHDITPKMRSFKSKCELKTGETMEAKDERYNTGDQVLQSCTSSKGIKQHFISTRDFQQYISKVHCDLMKEFKDIKLSLSRQIMNLQLDVDRILANQSQESPERLGFKGLLSHHQRPYGQPDLTGPIDEMEFKTYSSLKTQQNIACPTSSSSGENYPVPPSKFESHHKNIHDMSHCDSWNSARGHYSHQTIPKRLRNSQLDTTAFQNLLNNPIYRDATQTNSEKNCESSDSEISSSCEGEAKSEDQEAESSLDIGKEHTDPMEHNSNHTKKETFFHFAQRSDEEHTRNLYAGHLKNSVPNSDCEDTAKQSDFKSAYHHMRSKEGDLDLLSGDKRENRLTTKNEHRYGKTKTSNGDGILEHVSHSNDSKNDNEDDARLANILECYSMAYTSGKDNINSHLNFENRISHGNDSLCEAAAIKGTGSERLGSKILSRPILTEAIKKIGYDDSCFTSIHEKIPLNGVTEETQTILGKDKFQNHQHREKHAESEWTPCSKDSFRYAKYEEGQNDKFLSERSSSEDEEDSHNKKYAKMESKHRRTTQNDSKSQNQQYEKARKGRRTLLSEEEFASHHGTDKLPEMRTISQMSNGGKHSSPTQNEAHALEDHNNIQPFTLKGWSAAFLQANSKASTKMTVQNLTEKNEVLQTEKESQQEEPQHKEKENKNHHDQYAIRQLSGKSSKGGCAWTVIEPPMSPRTASKGTQGNGVGSPISKIRPRHHYILNN